MELLQAWGFFDPKIQANFDTKYSKGDQLYGLFYGGLKVPIWYGPSVNLSFERNAGTLLNPESFTGNGILIGGLSLPLGNGLFIDERRNAVKQARIIKNLNQAEQWKLLNKLLLQAAKDYCDWYFSYNKVKTSRLAFDLALVRLDAIRQRVTTGDLAGMDSIEALLETQRREVAWVEAKVEYQNQRLWISNYLWTAEQVPLELDTGAMPELPMVATLPTSDTLHADLLRLVSIHPELLKNQFKMEQNQVEIKFRKEQLKPTLNLNYNPYSYQPFGANALYSTYNYKFGADFVFPVFLRKERGKLELTRIKQRSFQFERLQLQRDLQTNLQMAFNEWTAIENLLKLQELAVKNFQLLRDAEQELFSHGESSLFLINTRERTLIEARLKLEEMKVKRVKAWMNYQYHRGIIGI